MLIDELRSRPSQPMMPNIFINATQLSFSAGSNEFTLRGRIAGTQEDLVENHTLPCAIVRKDGEVYAPLELFTEGLFTYFTLADDSIDIERSGHVAHFPIDGKCAYRDDDSIMIPVMPVITELELMSKCEGDEFEVIVDSIKNGPRKLTPAEERLPYAKYYFRYFQTPLHERADFKVWSAKAGHYSGNNMMDPSKMLHIADVNKILDENYRKNEWHEGWTMFDDGSSVMCARTEFPGTTAEAFKWWFAWHVKEDIRYMLWCPPSHYGISPSLELRRRISNMDLPLNEKIHDCGHGPAIHHVFESTGIDYLSYFQAAPCTYFDIDFNDLEFRGFTKENAEKIMNSDKLAAVVGGSPMLHFFVEDEDGPGKSVLYSHFWFGHDHRDENGLWHGSMPGKNIMLMTPLMGIAQHCNKEFPLLAAILPELYAEEGNKPI